MLGTSGSQLARKFESARLVNVDDMTLKRLLDSPDILNALMNVEGFRNLNSDLEKIINKSEKINKIKKDDKDDKLLYIGKAKNLKKRVSSYFTKQHDSAKTRVLVKKIVTIKHIVVDTETDALLLEKPIIHQPWNAQEKQRD